MKLFPIDYSPLLCSVDPITLTGLALGLGGAATGLAIGGAFSHSSSSSSGEAPQPTAPTPPQQVAPAQAQPGQKPKQTQPQSFVGAAAVPSTQFGQKTLLGQ